MNYPAKGFIRLFPVPSSLVPRLYSRLTFSIGPPALTQSSFPWS
jgi:hypothetical protein